MPQIFFDTYALIEIIRGNKNYSLYTDFVPAINDFVLAELHYSLIKDYGEEKADIYFNKYFAVSLRAPAEVIKSAMKFRKANSRKNLSIIDCIGYFHAKSLNIKFLTGDKQFEGLSGVEFVK